VIEVSIGRGFNYFPPKMIGERETTQMVKVIQTNDEVIAIVYYLVPSLVFTFVEEPATQSPPTP